MCNRSSSFLRARRVVTETRTSTSSVETACRGWREERWTVRKEEEERKEKKEKKKEK